MLCVEVARRAYQEVNCKWTSLTERNALEAVCKHLRWSIYRCWQDIFSAAKFHDLSTAPDIWNAFRDKSFKFIFFYKVVVTLKSRLQCSDRPLLKAWDTAWSCNDRKIFQMKVPGHWCHLRLSPGNSSLGSLCVTRVTPFSLANWLSSSGITQQLFRFTWTQWSYRMSD